MNETTKYRNLGAEAFRLGKICAPFAALGSAYTNQRAIDWQDGWINENLDQPIPEWSDDENIAYLKSRGLL